MLEFDYPWIFFLLPLPLLVYWLSGAYKERREAVRSPFFEKLAEFTGRKPEAGAVILRSNLLQKILGPLVWLLVLAALARPQWVEDPITKILAARDLMLAVDLSGSMEERDFTDPDGNRIDRLEAVRMVLDGFIERREGDRIGLIVFGNAAYLQAPLTQDHEICRLLLAEARVRMAGPQTMMGDAIGLATKLFAASETEKRVLILLTDGNDTGSKVPPGRAAAIAADHNVTIHTIAIGDPQTTGERALDIETLQEISETAGGRFFRADDREQLEEIYQEIEKLEPDEFESLSYRPTRPLYHWPLGAAAVLIMGYHLLMAFFVGVSSMRRRAHA